MEPDISVIAIEKAYAAVRKQNVFAPGRCSRKFPDAVESVGVRRGRVLKIPAFGDKVLPLRFVSEQNSANGAAYTSMG
jgi:hypothetical protein